MDEKEVEGTSNKEDGLLDEIDDLFNYPKCKRQDNNKRHFQKHKQKYEGQKEDSSGLNRVINIPVDILTTSL